MKRKAAIGRLTEQAKNVMFPDPCHDFDRFSHALVDLIKENFGYSTDVNYNQDNATFYWEASEVVCFKEHGYSVMLERTFDIDPRKDLETEFQRVFEEREALVKETHAIFKALKPSGYGL